LVIAIGTFIYGLGVNFLMRPNGIISGGITGIAMVINYALPVIPIGVMIFVINIPIFIVGFKVLGWRFLLASLVGMLGLSVFIDLIELFSFPLTDNPLLAALFSGVITGFGLGLVFLVGASTGGTDIIVKVVRQKHQHFNLGTLVLILDVIIILIYAVTFRMFEAGMYSLIAIFIESKLIDVVLYGVNYGKVVYIISDKAEEINKAINEEMDRGVTKLYGEGGYSGEKKTVLLVAIKRRQITKLKQIIKKADPKAFVIMTESREVLGEGFQKNEE
ncbi:MAG: YitT family protein, partial [Oscillospiraceae bacterium]|nr:YitT family protein [Oscillospiraceae bacterium]